MRTEIFTVLKGCACSCALGVLVLIAACQAPTEATTITSTSKALDMSGPCLGADENSPLAQAACSADLLMGTAVQNWIVEQDPEYVDALALEFTGVTPENELKWGVLQPVDSETWDFAAADALVDLAKANGQAIKGHALVWHEQLPPFVTEELSKNELKKLMRNHIKTTVKRYRDDIAAWDVVNEAVMQDGSFRESVFYNVMGPEYIEFAYRTAAAYAGSHSGSQNRGHHGNRHGNHHENQHDGNHRCDSHGAELYYNDWGIATINPKSDGVYALMADLVSKDVPVHGVGMQGHVDARYAPTLEGLLANFQRFADLGLTVNISELDVRVAGIPGSRAHKLAVQQKIYHTIAAACVQADNCVGITVWGVDDGHSWVDNFFGADDPLLLDADFNRKPAYRGTVDGFLGIPPQGANEAPNLATAGSFQTDAHGWSGFGGSSVELVTLDENSLNQSLLGTDRSATWQGPALDLLGVVQQGFKYQASAKVQLQGTEESAWVSLNAKFRCGTEDDYPWLGGATATPTELTAFTGNEFEVPVCDLNEAVLYLNGPAEGVGIIVDDVILVQTAEPLGEEVLLNTDFEESGDYWFGFGDAVTTQSPDAHEGSSALICTNRLDTWQGPATSLNGLLIQGATYRISAFAKPLGAPVEGTAINATVKWVCGDEQDYVPVASSQTEDGVWTELNGSFQVPFCEEFSELSLYFEGPAAGVDILIDDASVRQREAIPVLDPPNPGEPNLLPNGDFETDTSWWYSWAATLDVTDAIAYSGAQSLVASGSGVGPAATSIASLVTAGETYEISCQVSIGNADSADVSVKIALNCDGASTSYPTIAGPTTVSNGVWSAMSGQIAIPEACDMSQVQLQIEGGNVVNPVPDADIELYVDDVVMILKPVTENVVPNGDFETDTSGWYGWGVTLETTTLEAHSGAQSLLVTGGSAIGPAATDLWAVLIPGETYNFSYWVMIRGVESADVHIASEIVCGDTTDWPWIKGNVSVPEGVWTELAGTLTIDAACDLSKAQFYVEGGAAADLYVDDVVFSL